MRHAVLLTEDAERNLEELHRYIAETDSAAHAGLVLDRIVELADKLAEHPERGTVPAELRTLGTQDYRQLFFNPYRGIYRVYDDRVIIHLIAVGRRDMQSLLVRRLLAS